MMPSPIGRLGFSNKCIRATTGSIACSAERIYETYRLFDLIL